MQTSHFATLPHVAIEVDAATSTGPFEWWRHSFGHGAINNSPLPARVVDGVRKVKPRLIRIFLQEYFNVYPAHGVYDWTILDPYMDALAQTGTHVVATINLKPPVLFPTVDETIWRPNDVAEWQALIYQLVKRYSVDRPIVTHWEHANEPDIGESGACPYLMPTAEANHEFYQTLIQPILAAFPTAKVGGPAMASDKSPIFKGFIDLCGRHNTQLDFVSWHRYDSNLEHYRQSVATVRGYLAGFPGKQPELMLNEWNYGFDFSDLRHSTYNVTSVEEMAMEAQRAAFSAANILSMLETDLDWSHHFLIWDNCCYPDQFRSFYSEDALRGVMYKHWNEEPARFGLFSEGQSVRPQYFVFQMLSRMGDEKVAIHCPEPDVHVQAATTAHKLSVLAVNHHHLHGARDLIAVLHFRGLEPGVKTLTAYRIDDERHWSSEALELIPVEERTVCVLPDFTYQFYLPADSVLLVTLEDKD
jgi:hypothetical protein